MAVGILAYGSLLEDPGYEIRVHIVDRRPIPATEFPVEFARYSSSRGGAPTLVPFDDGRPVPATLLVLDDVVTPESATNMLYRRETHKEFCVDRYQHSDRPGSNTVVVNSCVDLQVADVFPILYTRIASNIKPPEHTAAALAEMAIASVRTLAIESALTSGIGYLLAAKRSGAETGLSREYEDAILAQTGTTNLTSALTTIILEIATNGQLADAVSGSSNGREGYGPAESPPDEALKRPPFAEEPVDPDAPSGVDDVSTPRRTPSGVTPERRARLAVQGLILAAAILYFALGNSRFYFLLVVPATLLAGAVIGGPFAAAVKPLGDRFGRFVEQSIPSLDRELEPIRQERNALEAQPQQKDPDANVLRNFRLGLNRLEEYYTVNLAQARSSFRLSAFALVSGFLVILLGLGLLYAGKGGIGVPAISTASGVIVEFIGAGYFYVYKRSIAQVNYFYQNLLRQQDTALAISLSDQLDPGKQDEARVRLIEILINRAVLRPPDSDRAPK